MSTSPAEPVEPVQTPQVPQEQQVPQPADSNPVLENLEWLQRTRADRLAARRGQG
ncbi:hypothetical protein ACWD6K_09565 [Streptomyces sp. NPDC002431]